MVKTHAHSGVSRALLLAILTAAIGAALFWLAPAPAADAANGDAADEFFFYRASDGAYRYYNMNPSGQLGNQILGGTGYSTGWSSITAVDLDGDGQDELFFYRSTDGAYRYYDVKSNGTLGAQLAGGLGYSLGWSSITAVDLDGDSKDELFFYRSTDGAYRYYKMQPNGTLGAQLAGGLGYSLGWSSITAVDLDGDRKDEFFFYRKTDGAFRYYKMKPNGQLGNQLLGGLGYSLGWSSITAVDLEGDRKDEFFFYRSTDGAYRYYKMNPNGQLGTQLSGGLGYSLGWTSITAVNIDFNTPILPPPPPPPAGPCEGTAGVLLAQCQTLVSIYNFTNGPGWEDRAGWLVGNPCSPQWERVTCVGGVITTLDLSDNLLSGSLPNLTGLGPLVTLDLAENSISSLIPASLGNLKQLQVLDMSRNALTGMIPVQLTTMTALQDIDLSQNTLTGGIPVGFGSLGGLIDVDLASNQTLGGSIPADLAARPTLQRLDLSRTLLTGTIPDFAGPLTELFLDHNDLTGVIPISLGSKTTLQLLNLSDQVDGLTGPIPAQFVGLTGLRQLDLASNALSGPIPEIFGGMTSLQSVDLSDNILDGAIPDSLGNPQKFTLNGLDLGFNFLNGPVPNSLSSLIAIPPGGLFLCGNVGLTATNPSTLFTYLEARDPLWDEVDRDLC